jgi:hypothetical protein
MAILKVGIASIISDMGIGSCGEQYLCDFEISVMQR